ncbi:hypothetical protein L7F22_002569 [Adiantum nelumboides]|nr:hypothetical protein [Adiantum nelumboides]
MEYSSLGEFFLMGDFNGRTQSRQCETYDFEDSELLHPLDEAGVERTSADTAVPTPYGRHLLRVKPPKEDSLRKKEWRTPIKSLSNSLKASHHPRRKAMLNMKGLLQGREESESSDESMEDVAPRRRRAQRSPIPTKRKRSPHSPHRRESKREEKNSKKKKERKRSPSSPSSSRSSSSDEGSGYSSQERQRRGHPRSYAAWKRSSKLKKFKEGGKNISFLTYDGTFGATDKLLAFIQQFDAAFGDEGFTESSKLRHVAMHFQKSARQWWASLRANGEASKTWKALRASIMKQFLASDAKDKGPILSAHKQLVAKKLEEAADGQKKRTQRKKEKQALREKGHVVPAPFSAAKDKDLIKLATRGVVKLFNAVSKAQSVQEGAKVAKTTDAKDVAKRSKSTFLAMLQDGNESSFRGQKQPVHDKMVSS